MHQLRAAAETEPCSLSGVTIPQPNGVSRGQDPAVDTAPSGGQGASASGTGTSLCPGPSSEPPPQPQPLSSEPTAPGSDHVLRAGHPPRALPPRHGAQTRWKEALHFQVSCSLMRAIQDHLASQGPSFVPSATSLLPPKETCSQVLGAFTQPATASIPCQCVGTVLLSVCCV